MIMGYAKVDDSVWVMELFTEMRQECVVPDHRTFVGTLKACSSMATLEEGKQVDGIFVKRECLEKVQGLHSQIVKKRFELDLFVGNTLVDTYAKCGSMEDAWHVFNWLPHLDVVSWNAMISGYANNEEGGLALELYVRMCQEGVLPDHRTFFGAFKACSSLAAFEEGTLVAVKFVKIGCLEKGREIHSQILKSGFQADVFVGTALVDMYAKWGSMEDALHACEELRHCDVVACKTMMMGFAAQEGAIALQTYEQMYHEGMIPDHHTFASVLKACSSLVAGEAS